MDAARNQGIDLSSSSDLPIWPISFAIRLVFPTARSPAWKAIRLFRVEDFDAFSRFLCCYGGRDVQNCTIPLRNQPEWKWLEEGKGDSGEGGASEVN